MADSFTNGQAVQAYFEEQNGWRPRQIPAPHVPVPGFNRGRPDPAFSRPVGRQVQRIMLSPLPGETNMRFREIVLP